MKRAYPHHGKRRRPAPREILTTIFPLQYWDLIRKNAADQNLIRIWLRR
jgi:hypothetical protein